MERPHNHRSLGKCTSERFLRTPSNRPNFAQRKRGGARVIRRVSEKHSRAVDATFTNFSSGNPLLEAPSRLSVSKYRIFHELANYFAVEASRRAATAPFLFRRRPYFRDVWTTLLEIIIVHPVKIPQKSPRTYINLESAEVSGTSENFVMAVALHNDEINFVPRRVPYDSAHLWPRSTDFAYVTVICGQILTSRIRRHPTRY